MIQSKGHHAMTQAHSAPVLQLDALKFADAEAMFAEVIRGGPQALIEGEAMEGSAPTTISAAETARRDATGTDPRRYR
ncbi:hypothetical protein A5631_07665 [Mycolicibacter heraklionensis]|nr:hypothetical protein [Mycolicibacter virginiensis]OBJ33063.1 hypothetical protein A5631_07665 [Mycolicibacter heraklionensis]ULP48235.1 hypothetical protein MJO54_03500 [Mycolicibacter virginiensis]